MKIRKEIKAKFIKLINFWPPFLGAGIKVVKSSPDLRHIRVQMKLTRLNSNYVGTHYGGSLYSMTDPFYMLMCMENLGSRYIVWDKAATIRFKKPGKGIVHADFTLTAEKIEEIKKATASGEKYEPVFEVLIKDQKGDVVAAVEKQLYIKLKPKK